MFALDLRAARATWTVLLILGAVGCVYLIRKTLLVFVLAILLSALMGPIANLADRFHNRRVPRTLSIGVLYLALLAILTAGLVYVGTNVVDQATELAVSIPKFAQDPQLVNSIPLPWGFEPYRFQMVEFLRRQFSDHGEELMAAVTGAGKGVLSALSNIVFVVLIPILSFFFLKDADAIGSLVAAQFSEGDSRGFVEDVMADVHVLLMEFMRAMMLLCFSTFLVFAAVLALMQVPYALLLAVLAGVFELVPVAGPLTAAVTIVAVATFGGYPHITAIVIFLIVYRLFLDYVLQPHLMGQGLALPPLAIIFGVLAGEQIAGISGMFLSIPALASLRVIYVQFRKQRTITP